MATKYQYETSPRKLEPEYKKEKKKRNIKVVKDLPKQDVQLSKEQIQGTQISQKSNKKQS